MPESNNNQEARTAPPSTPEKPKGLLKRISDNVTHRAVDQIKDIKPAEWGRNQREWERPLGKWENPLRETHTESGGAVLSDLEPTQTKEESPERQALRNKFGALLAGVQLSLLLTSCAGPIVEKELREPTVAAQQVKSADTTESLYGYTTELELEYAKDLSRWRSEHPEYSIGGPYETEFYPQTQYYNTGRESLIYCAYPSHNGEERSYPVFESGQLAPHVRKVVGNLDIAELGLALELSEGFEVDGDLIINVGYEPLGETAQEKIDQVIKDLPIGLRFNNLVILTKEGGVEQEIPFGEYLLERDRLLGECFDIKKVQQDLDAWRKDPERNNQGLMLGVTIFSIDNNNFGRSGVVLSGEHTRFNSGEELPPHLIKVDGNLTVSSDARLIEGIRIDGELNVFTKYSPGREENEIPQILKNLPKNIKFKTLRILRVNGDVLSTYSLEEYLQVRGE